MATLSAAYAFDEGSGSTIHDYSGNGRDMTVAGTNSWVTGRNGYPNAFQAGASGSDGAAFSNGSAMSDLTGDVTLQVWYKSTATVPSAGIEHAGGLYSGTGTTRLAAYAYRNRGGIASSPHMTGRDSSGTILDCGLNGTEITDNNWHNAAFVYHSSGLVESYLDGTLVASASPTSLPIGSEAFFIAVGSLYSGGSIAQSIVQDMRVFDGALTGTEINIWMNIPVHLPTGTVALSLKKMVLAGTGKAGIYVVQSFTLNDGTYSGAFTDPVSEHNTIVMVVTDHATTPATLGIPVYDGSEVDGATKIVWASEIEPPDDTAEANAVTMIWLLPDVPTSGTTLSIPHGTTSFYTGIFAYEIANLGSSPVVVQFNKAGGFDGVDQGVNATDTSTAAGNIVFASLVQDGIADSYFPPGSPWVSTGLSGDSAYNSVASYQVTTEAGQTLDYTGAGDGSADWSAVIAEIAPTPAAIFTPVGSLSDSEDLTFSLTPGNIGDLIVMEIRVGGGTTVWATDVESDNATWEQTGDLLQGTEVSNTAIMFFGTVTSTDEETVTITLNGSPGGLTHAVYQEFEVSTGAWELDKQANLDNSSGQDTWPSMTPDGAHELAFGYAINTSVSGDCTTTGYTFNNNVDGQENAAAYNADCDASTQTPAWASGGQAFGIMVLVKGVTPGGSASVSGALSLKKMVLSGTSAEKAVITGAVKLKKMVLAGVSHEKAVVTGAIKLKKMVLAGVSHEKAVVTGAVKLKKMVLAATVVKKPAITGSIKLKKMVISGVSHEKTVITGSIYLKKMRVHGEEAKRKASTLFVFAPP